jgi:hypothetical protein
MEFTEEKLQTRARNKLYQNKLKQCFNTISRHAAFSFTRLPRTSTTDLRQGYLLKQTVKTESGVS